MTTTSTGVEKSEAASRKIWRNRRFTRLRVTAEPTRRETESPRRETVSPSGRSHTCKWKKRPGSHFPVRRNRTNSLLARSRHSREKRIQLLRSGQADPPLAPPGGEDLPTSLGRIALAEAKLAGSLDLGRSVGRLHDSFLEKTLEKSHFPPACQPFPRLLFPFNAPEPTSDFLRSRRNFSNIAPQ